LSKATGSTGAPGGHPLTHGAAGPFTRVPSRTSGCADPATLRPSRQGSHPSAGRTQVKPSAHSSSKEHTATHRDFGMFIRPARLKRLVIPAALNRPSYLRDDRCRCVAAATGDVRPGGRAHLSLLSQRSRWKIGSPCTYTSGCGCLPRVPKRPLDTGRVTEVGQAWSDSPQFRAEVDHSHRAAHTVPHRLHDTPARSKLS
jgi:hypothetical protein